MNQPNNMAKRHIAKASDLFAKHYRQGHPIAAIAAAYDVSPYRVKTLLRNAGIITPRKPVERRKMARSKPIRAIALLAQGARLRDVAKTLKTSNCYISNIAHDAQLAGILPDPLPYQQTRANNTEIKQND
jgi:transposase